MGRDISITGSVLLDNDLIQAQQEDMCLYPMLKYDPGNREQQKEH